MPFLRQATARKTSTLHPSKLTSASCKTWPLPQGTRHFSVSATRSNWLQPRKGHLRKSQKGDARVCTGGSSRGTTVQLGDYGLRLLDHHRRVSAAQLKRGEDIIRFQLRGTKYTLFKRISASVCVFKKGNDQRMGKGMGKFDHWACRIPVSRVVFELKGESHERTLMEALRIAGDKLPGLWETIRKGDPPKIGITSLGNGVTLETLRRARREIPAPKTSEGPITGPMVTDQPPTTISTTATT